MTFPSLQVPTVTAAPHRRTGDGGQHDPLAHPNVCGLQCMTEIFCQHGISIKYINNNNKIMQQSIQVMVDSPLGMANVHIELSTQLLDAGHDDI